MRREGVEIDAEKSLLRALLYSQKGGESMYAAPRVKDFGRIELHTFVNGSPVAFNEVEELTATSSGGGGIGLGVIGLVGGAIALAGRGSNNQTVEAALPNEDEEQLDHR